VSDDRPWPYKFAPQMSIDEFIEMLPRSPVYRTRVETMLRRSDYKCVEDVISAIDNRSIRRERDIGYKSIRYLRSVLSSGEAPEPEDEKEEDTKKAHDENHKRRDLAFDLRSRGWSLKQIAARIDRSVATVAIMLKKDERDRALASRHQTAIMSRPRSAV